MGQGRGNYGNHGWAQVGQVDPTWTNYGKKRLSLGLMFKVKVDGIIKLERRQCLATDFMHLKGKFGLNSVLAEICFTYCCDIGQNAYR